MPPASFVAYYRVSTAQQGASGLGLEAQHAAVRGYLPTVGGVLMDEFTEIESGRRKTRPELAAALAACRRLRARLVIAKLDRLARNVAFIANLMDSRVEFVAVDNPHASRLTLHVLAAVAEHEAAAIGERTRAALAAARARGVRLGVRGAERARKHIAAADAFALTLAPLISGMHDEGITTVRAICGELNARAVPTAKGGRWHLPTTHRLLARIAELT